MKFEIKNLSCERGGRYLFRNLNFFLSDGQLVLIQGQNGAGKSTLLKILAGLVTPQKGSVFSSESELNQHISYLGHKEGLKRALTPYENVKHLLSQNARSHFFSKIDTIFSMFDLQNVATIPCWHLSQGQRRKVVLAAIVLMRKKLWILDEPFTALDKQSESLVKKLFEQHLTQGGMIVMASHHQGEQEYIINQIIDLKAHRC